MPPRPVQQLNNDALKAELNDPKTNRERRGQLRREEQRRNNQALVARFANGSLTALGVLQQVITAAKILGDGETVPSSLTGCRNLLKANRVYVNIYDFIDFNRGTVRTLTVCSSIGELRRRCNRKGFFPKEEAKQSELKKLLEVLF